MDTTAEVQRCRTCDEGHPYVVFREGRETAYAVACDGHLIPVGVSFAEAFDFMFKFFWNFSLKYPCGLITFFKLFETKIYKLAHPGQKTPPSVNEVARLFGL